MHVLILAHRTCKIKTKFAYYYIIFFLLNGFLVVLIGQSWEKRSAGVGLVSLQFFGYLKRQLVLLILRMFLLLKIYVTYVTSLHNKLRILLCTYVGGGGGVRPLFNTSLFTLKLKFCPNSLRMTPESQRP